MVLSQKSNLFLEKTKKNPFGGSSPIAFGKDDFVLFVGFLGFPRQKMVTWGVFSWLAIFQQQTAVVLVVGEPSQHTPLDMLGSKYKHLLNGLCVFIVFLKNGWFLGMGTKNSLFV